MFFIAKQCFCSCSKQKKRKKLERKRSIYEYLVMTTCYLISLIIENKKYILNDFETILLL